MAERSIDTLDFASSLAELRAGGARLLTIRPADNPAEALLELPDGDRVRLRRTPVALSRGDDAHGWHTGRAGMHYRDLIPDRWDGRFVASHIAVPAGGEVPDDVHFHDVRFQFLAVRHGWVRLVYEDQGDPFVMEAGDVVLQPPTIRHRVLETSPGFEIVEVGAPADHLTTLDHGLALPNGTGDADREWAGQRFVHYRAGSGAPVAFDTPGFTALDTGLGAATNGVVEVRMVSAGDGAFADPVEAEFRFMFVMDGSVSVTFADGTGRRLSGGDSLAAPAVAGAVLADPSTDCVLLDVVVPR